MQTKQFDTERNSTTTKKDAQNMVELRSVSHYLVRIGPAFIFIGLRFESILVRIGRPVPFVMEGSLKNCGVAIVFFAGRVVSISSPKSLQVFDRGIQRVRVGPVHGRSLIVFLQTALFIVSFGMVTDVSKWYGMIVLLVPPSPFPAISMVLLVWFVQMVPRDFNDSEDVFNLNIKLWIYG